MNKNRMSAAEFQAYYSQDQIKGRKKKSKYNNCRLEVDGMKFDSKKEYNRFNELMLMQSAGLISDLKRQVKFLLVEKSATESAAYYVADFTYNEGCRKIIEDVKSPITKKNPVYILKRKLVKSIYKDYVFRET